VEVARDRRRSPDRPQGSQIDCAFHRGGGDHRRFPAAYAAAARRLPLCAAADHPASDAVIPTSLLPAPRHQPIAGGRRQQAFEKKFKAYPIGYFHIDIAELQTAEGKLYLYVAIDRTSKFAFVQLVKKTGRTSASAFLEALIAVVPYKIHTVLTDNGIQFTFPPRYADGPTARYVRHMFDRLCQENRIEHRLTKIKHPWTNGQVERMNRTIKEATVKRYHYDRHGQLEAHLADFINAYNYARRLKTLKGLTPYEYICKCWTSQPERFKLNPLQKMPGLNN
jgi:transposase InsO family protein